MARKAKKKSKKALKAKDLSSRSASSVKGGAVGPCFRPRPSALLGKDMVGVIGPATSCARTAAFLSGRVAHVYDEIVARERSRVATEGWGARRHGHVERLGRAQAGLSELVRPLAQLRAAAGAARSRTGRLHDRASGSWFGT